MLFIAVSSYEPFVLLAPKLALENLARIFLLVTEPVFFVLSPSMPEIVLLASLAPLVLASTSKPLVLTPLALAILLPETVLVLPEFDVVATDTFSLGLDFPLAAQHILLGLFPSHLTETEIALKPPRFHGVEPETVLVLPEFDVAATDTFLLGFDFPLAAQHILLGLFPSHVTGTEIVLKPPLFY